MAYKQFNWHTNSRQVFTNKNYYMKISLFIKRKITKQKRKLKICLILHNWCLVYVQDFKSNKFLKNKTKQTQKHIEAYTKYKTYIRAEAAKRKR